MALVCPLLTSTLLSWHPGSCEDEAWELLLPQPCLPLLKSALCPLPQMSSLLIYQDYFNNNNNNDLRVLISRHLMKSQQPGIAGVRSAVKLHELEAPHWRKPE